MERLRRRRLRRISTVDFRKSEHTNYLELLVQHPELTKLKKDDAILLRSYMGDQLIILHGFHVVNDDHGIYRTLHSERLRLIDKGAWNGLMIADYGRQVGIEFVGLPTFDQHVKQILKNIFPDTKNEERKTTPTNQKPKEATWQPKKTGTRQESTSKSPSTSSPTISQRPKTSSSKSYVSTSKTSK